MYEISRKPNNSYTQSLLYNNVRWRRCTRGKIHMQEFLNSKFHDNPKTDSRASNSLQRFRTGGNTAFCHYMPQHFYLLSLYSALCSHSSLHCFSTDIYCYVCVCVCVCVRCAICDFLMADLKKQYICIKFFLGSCIMTKTSVYSYDPPNKQQSLSWKPGPLQTQRMQSNSGESSTPCWKSIFVCQGIAQQYFVPTSITAERFCNWTWNKLKLKCLKTASQPKTTGRTRSGWFNMALCQCMLHCEYSNLATKSTPVVFQAPYLPDLASYNICLFLRMKSQLQGYCLQNVSEIQEKLLNILHVIPKCQFQWCCLQWQKCWTHFINSERNYSEGDNNDKKTKVDRQVRISLPTQARNFWICSYI
jgi:hypothetical protein